ncbi:hypothetical protein KUTeg_016359, partial [Tegillarca granosa]
TSLDFLHVENTPPKKKKRNEREDFNVESTTDEDESSVTVKTFYGGKEKKNFPHSPRRRKSVNKLLARISGDENETSTSEEEWLSFRKKELEHVDSKTGDVSNNYVVEKQKILRPRNRSYSSTGNQPVNKSVERPKFITPDAKKSQKSLLSPLVTALIKENDLPNTPPSSGKKFFRTKSPASANKAVGSVIIGKGFNLKFVPKRKLSTESLQNSTTAAKKQKQAKSDKKMKKNTAYEASNLCSPVNKEQKVLVEKNDYKYSSNSPISSDSLSRGDNNDRTSRQSSIDSENFEKTVLVKTNDNVDDNVQSECDKESSVSGLCDVIDEVDGSPELFSNDSVSGRSTPTSENSSSTMSDSVASIKSGPTLRKHPDKKYYPLFSQNVTPKQKTLQEVISKTLRTRKNLRSPSSPRVLAVKEDSDQMILDAGQKKWGASQCEVCGMVFAHGSPVDHTTHANICQCCLSLQSNVIKFWILKGWKKERVVAEYPDDGSRIIMVLPEDQKYAVKKVEDINKVMGEELGFPDPSLCLRSGYKAFLFVSDDKMVDGCCVAESVTEGYRVIPDSQSQSSQPHPGRRPWCCESDAEPASVGISRIWVNGQRRRKGVATKLLDSVRHWFDYGVPIGKDQLAFSDPTPDGKNLATKYTGTKSFLVYKYT